MCNDNSVEYKNNSRITCVLCLELISVEWRRDRHLYNGALQATEVLLLVLDHFIKGSVVVRSYRGPL